MSRVHRISLFCLACLLLVGLGDGRAHADNTAQPLPFAQDWNDPNLITTNDDWSGVPGIMGFQGDGLTGDTGTDPQTILIDDATPTVDVIANQTNPNITNGGVAEFESAYQVVALQGSGTADAPYLLIHLNTLNYENIQVAYNLRDIDGSADDAEQQVALHYRVGGTGSYTNLPDGYVADATTGPSQATLVTPVSVTLPAAADNQPLVMLRIMTTNAVGNDEWVGIDDLSITGTFVSDFPPMVNSHSPAAFALGQVVDAPITVTFNEEVTISGDVPIVCSLSGAQYATPTSGDNLTYTLLHTDFLPNESCTISLPAAQVTDDDTDDPPDNMAADYTWRFSTGFAIINEIHADPDPVNGDANGDGTVHNIEDEFVEIVNNTGADLDISEWTLSDLVGVRHTFPPNTIIPDGCAIVIFGGGTPTGSFGSAQVQIASGGTLALNNGGDTLTLSDGATIQASVTYGTEGGNNQSLTRDPDISGTFVQHSLAMGSGGALFSPGTQINGSQFAGCNHCGQPATLIHAIQGSGLDSPLAGQIHTIEGVVVGDFQAETTIRGFYVQEEDGEVDSDPATSEGLFVYDNFPALWRNVDVGQRVRATGTVTEFAGLTELSAVRRVEVCGDTAVPTPLTLTLPFSTTTFLERAEGMLVTLPQTLTANENYFLGRFGELVLSNGRLTIPTNVASPGLPAQTMLADNLRNMLILDDGRALQNPDPITHPAPELTAVNTIRSGDSISGLTGILTYSWSGIPGTDNYRLHPTNVPTYTHTNPRLAAPTPISGTLRVAGFNVLNYFNGDGLGGGFPTARGASSPEEFTRQRDKIIPAILGLDADIIGLMEMENDGYAATSAIADLVDGLNTVAGAGIYAYVNPGVPTLGSDEIAVGLIYRPTAVTFNSVATTGTGAFAARNRQPLAATFTEISSGETFTVVVNHFKSKGSDCNDGAVNDPDNVFPDDPDTGDGQGNCNLTRLLAATQLHTWLASDPTGSSDPDFLIIGDLNAYAREDPLTLLRDNGYTNLAADINPGVYSYVFAAQAGQLDYTLSSPSLTAQVVGAATWLINTDEPSVLDYNMEFKTPGQQVSLYSADPYRASDHDPVIIGLELGATADYSDLDSMYGTAWHVGSGALRLGTLWDADNVHTFGADDASDEGVQRGPGSGPGGQWQPGVDGGSLNITVTGSGNGCLYAWIDWNNDGMFDDSDAPENLEYIIRGETMGSGNYAFEIPVGTFDPPPGPPTPTRSFHLRVRLYAACGSGPTGVAIEGEVEDYRLVFSPTAVTLQTFQAQTNTVPWLLLVMMVMSGVTVWGYGRRRAG
ncbi:MAG TPA: ExeM/NucH family extracellular endonuclease [Chloroflexota bacterium]|nr:ExeM/NucH family extracellular endonuclease [Chloroflexota bacterium]